MKNDIKQKAFDFARSGKPYIGDFGCLSAGELNRLDGFEAGYRAAFEEMLKRLETPDAFGEKTFHYENSRYRELAHNIRVDLYGPSDSGD